MSANATVIRTGITHDVSKHVDFHFYAYTKCLVRIDWVEAFEVVTLEVQEDVKRALRALARRTDKEVDCMACIARETE